MNRLPEKRKELLQTLLSMAETILIWKRMYNQKMKAESMNPAAIEMESTFYKYSSQEEKGNKGCNDRLKLEKNL